MTIQPEGLSQASLKWAVRTVYPEICPLLHTPSRAAPHRLQGRGHHSAGFLKVLSIPLATPRDLRNPGGRQGLDVNEDRFLPSRSALQSCNSAAKLAPWNKLPSEPAASQASPPDRCPSAVDLTFLPHAELVSLYSDPLFFHPKATTTCSSQASSPPPTQTPT